MTKKRLNMIRVLVQQEKRVDRMILRAKTAEEVKRLERARQRILTKIRELHRPAV